MKFNMLSELSILTLKSDNDDSFPYAISKAYDPCEKNEAKRSGILQDLFFLSRTMKQDANLRDIGELMHVDERIFEQGHVENILS